MERQQQQLQTVPKVETGPSSETDAKKDMFEETVDFV